MRVLHVFKTYWPETFGGIERTIDALCKHTAPFGVESEVFTLAPTGDWPSDKDSVPIIRATRTVDIASTGFSLDAFGKFSDATRRADIVHYHFPWPFMDVLHMLARHGKPSLATYYSDIVKQQRLLTLYTPLMRAFLTSMDRIVATSEPHRRSSRVLCAFAEKVDVVPLGLAEEDYPQPSATTLERWRSRFPRPFVLFTGVFRYYKGLDILIDAASKLDCDIVLVGDGPERAQLERKVRERALHHVHFLGRLPDEDKMALLDLSRALVLPSHLPSEAYGLSLVEAAMRSVPMICCEIGTGTSFVNIDGETGLVVPPADPVRLATAIRTLIADADLARAMGRRARARYDAELTAQRLGERYAAIYTSIASKEIR